MGALNPKFCFWNTKEKKENNEEIKTGFSKRDRNQTLPNCLFHSIFDAIVKEQKHSHLPLIRKSLSDTKDSPSYLAATMLQTALWITSLLIWLPFTRTPSHFLHLKNLPLCESCWEAELSPTIRTQPISASLSWAKGTGIGPNQVHLLQLRCAGARIMERGDVVPAAVVAAARSGSLAAEVVSGALGQQGPLRNHSAAPHTLQLCCQDAMALGPKPDLQPFSLRPTIHLINVLSAQVSWNWDWHMQVSYFDGWNNWKLKVQILIYEMTTNPTGRWVVPSILTL